MRVGGDVRAWSDRKTQRWWKGRLVFITAMLAGMLVGPSNASSKRWPGDLAGKKRAHLDLDAVYWVGSINLPRNGNGLRIHNEATGVFGHPRYPLSVGLGYGLSENLVLGARVDFSADTREDLGPGGVTIRSAIAPYMELMFMRDRYVRPFVHLRAGLGGGRTFVRVPGQRTLESTGASMIYPLLAVGLGTHVFLSEEVSFDALFSLEHRWNVRRQSATDGPVVADVDIGRWQMIDTSLSAAFTFGFSRWF